jgi:hypothetical protein
MSDDVQKCTVVYDDPPKQVRSLGKQRSWLRAVDQKPLGSAPADDHGVTFDQSDRPEERAFKEGRLDYLNGKNGCPYDGASIEGQHWLKGHHAEAGGYDNLEVAQDGEVEVPQTVDAKGPPPQQPPPPTRDDKPKPQIIRSLADLNRFNKKFKNWNKLKHAR